MDTRFERIVDQQNQIADKREVIMTESVKTVASLARPLGVSGERCLVVPGLGGKYVNAGLIEQLILGLDTVGNQIVDLERLPGNSAPVWSNRK